MSETKPQEIAVKKIVLQIGRKEIELSPAEAETLRDALDELMGKTSTIINTPYYYPYRIAAGCLKTAGGSFTLTSGNDAFGNDNGLAESPAIR